MIDIVLLGTSGTIPLPGRWLSALHISLGQEAILFDCGEGTQISMRAFGTGFRSLSAICVSHVHADHVSGLPGLLLTVANAGRTAPLDVLGPPGIRAVVAGLRVVAPYLPFEVRVHELAGNDTMPWAGATISALALDHAVPCLGYRLDVARAPRFDADRARALGVPVVEWKRLQRGESVDVAGRLVRPGDVLGAARRGLRIAFATDTRPVPALPDFARGADLLVLEGTYGDPADAPKAARTRHLLFAEAADIARQAEARRLWLTHFSAGLLDPSRYVGEATDRFPNTTVGHDGLRATLAFDAGSA